MIVSFADKDPERLFTRQRPKRLDPRLRRRALAKLLLQHGAAELDELRVPPGNQLEALRGDRAGQHSIRINDQWRICFVWTPVGPGNAGVIDYR